MILYSKNGNFLGIGKDELSFLGYEDLDEFKSIHSDVADLFVHRPGYIFKFKNFSWIDYALHSGAPKKSVIIKLKTGNEVEVPLKIKELFLYSKINDEELFYSIEFTNDMPQTTAVQNEQTLLQAESVKQVETPQMQSEPDLVIQEKQENISFEEDFKEDTSENITVNFENIKQEEKPVLKLKVDEDILEEPKEYSLKLDSKDEEINNKITDDFEVIEDIPKLKVDKVPQEEPPKLKVHINTDYIKELKKVKKEEDTIPTFETHNEISYNFHSEDNADFDLVQCVEDLGLDISLIGELITEYMQNIDDTIPKIKSAIDQNDEKLLKESIYSLKGISDSFQMTQLSNRLVHIQEATDAESKINELEKFKKIVAKFKEELI